LPLNKPPASSSKPETAVPDGPGDHELVARCQTGDTSAFNELITRYRQRCFSMIYQMVRNEDDAWDLAQDGFVRAWRSIGHFKGQSSFYTWLYRVMTNVALDWLRKKHIQGAQEFDDTVGLRRIEPGAVTAPKEPLEPSQRLADGEIRARINEAIEKLSPEHRTAVVLREIEGLEYTEIAETMDCSIGTVMSRLFYARKKLQSLLQDVYEQL
jgi:RNA polymerase sigma-70 factor (ECF subfamily)